MVESEEGKGSTFFFTLTVGSTDKRDIPLSLEDISGKTVLLVDDNPTNLRILESQCERWGLKTVSKESPIEALRLIESGASFDLAILDMQMPEMDGVGLGREIRKKLKKESLPMIMLTSMGSGLKDHEKALFNSSLSKPVRRQVLFKQIARILAKKEYFMKLENAEPSSGSKQGEPIKNLKILLTEDNMVNQKVALRILKKLGYVADVAGNGLEAIQALQNQNYDIVFMDMQMPEMDGLTATENIRKMPDFFGKQPLIVAMTANALSGDRERCLEAGMDDYISKPVKTDQIAQMLQKWFSSEGTLKMERNMAQG